MNVLSPPARTRGSMSPSTTLATERLLDAATSSAQLWLLKAYPLQRADAQVTRSCTSVKSDRLRADSSDERSEEPSPPGEGKQPQLEGAVALPLRTAPGCRDARWTSVLDGLILVP